MAGRHATLPVMAFAWETRIPFVPWTIVPYWSIDLFYAISFFLCRQRLELDRHALRLFSAQVIAVACFLLWPLRFSFERPEIGGVFGWLFDVLLGFDKPFNQAPSLHIVLLIVLWVKFAQYLHGAWRWVLHVWALLIGVSVLTTFQHHFIDIPTGLLAGWLCVWLWPEQGTPPLRAWRTAVMPGAGDWRAVPAGGGDAAGAGGPAARCGVVAAVAGGVVAAGGAGLCRAGYGGVPEARRWTPDDGRTLAAGAVPGCGLDQFAAVDAPCAAAGAGDGRRVAGAHSLHAHCRHRWWAWSMPAPSCPAVRRVRRMPACRCWTWWCPRRNSCARRPRPSSGCVRRAVAGVLCAGLFAQCRQRGDLAAAQWSCRRCDAAVAIVRAARPAIVLGRSSACHRGGKERA
jgi:membrane-associated phospholipid phosphatase